MSNIGCLNIVSSWDWGSFPQYLSFLATLGAVAWAVFLYDRSVKDKQREQPRLVYAFPVGESRRYKKGRKVGDLTTMDGDKKRRLRINFMVGGVSEEVDENGQPDIRAAHHSHLHIIRVTNASDEVITSVRLVMFLPRKGRHRVFNPAARQWPYIEPGGERLIPILLFSDSDDVKSPFLGNARPLVEFVDASGKKWEHGLGSPLKLVAAPKRTFQSSEQKPSRFVTKTPVKAFALGHRFHESAKG